MGVLEGFPEEEVAEHRQRKKHTHAELEERNRL